MTTELQTLNQNELDEILKVNSTDKAATKELIKDFEEKLKELGEIQLAEDEKSNKDIAA